MQSVDRWTCGRLTDRTERGCQRSLPVTTTTTTTTTTHMPRANARTTTATIARRLLRLVACLGCGVLALSAATGCDTKSFFDPGEMGRYDHQPLTSKILNTLDPGIDEPNLQFVAAVPPTADDLVAFDQDYEISKND